MVAVLLVELALYPSFQDIKVGPEGFAFKSSSSRWRLFDNDYHSLYPLSKKWNKTINRNLCFWNLYYCIWPPRYFGTFSFILQWCI
jgi:hypothetical protein